MMRDMAMKRNKRALTTWKQYVERSQLIKSRYPLEVADRNKAWLQWTKMHGVLEPKMATGHRGSW